MADNNSSSVVAIFAIIILAVLVFAGYYVFMRQGAPMAPATSTSEVRVDVPSAPASSGTTTETTESKT